MEPQKTQNTQMDTGEDRINLLSKRIIGCALTVLHALGTGFLGKVYENALVYELRKSGLAVSQQHPMAVRYDGIVVGEYTVDLLVEDIVLVELKVAKAIDEIHLAQCLNHLKATGLHLCPHDSPHSQMAPNICAKRGWAASIWANRLMSGSRRKS